MYTTNSAKDTQVSRSDVLVMCVLWNGLWPDNIIKQEANIQTKAGWLTAGNCVTLTHWGRVTHICIGKLSIIGSDNGLSPGRRQAIIWTNAGILLIGTLGTNFSEISSEIYTFSFKKMHLKMSSGKWRPCCLGLNVLSKGDMDQALWPDVYLIWK